MSKLPPLPQQYRSWADFYFKVEEYAKAQGMCYVPDELTVEVRWEESLFIDDCQLEYGAKEFWATEGKVVSVTMRDVKLELAEWFIDILKRKDTIEDLERSVLAYVPTSHATGKRLINFVTHLRRLT